MPDKPHILVVEDEALFAVMITDYLTECYKINCVSTASGEDAVKLAIHNKPRLVFMDIRLAGKIDGIETARRIREEHTVPIVFMTAFSTDQVKKSVMSFDGSEFVTKPVNIDTIGNFVQKYCFS